MARREKARESRRVASKAANGKASRKAKIMEAVAKANKRAHGSKRAARALGKPATYLVIGQPGLTK